jgi:hypothetical protein
MSSSHLSRRLSALEMTLRPDGPEVCIWGQTESGAVMTEKQFAAQVAARRTAGAPPNTRFTNVRWMTA